MTQRVLCALMGGVAMALAVATPVFGGLFSYTENFATPGVQADDIGETFAAYPDWTYFESPNTAAEARVDSPGGILSLATAGTSANTLTAQISSVAIMGAANFDVSTLPLKMSVGLGGYGANGAWRADPGFLGSTSRIGFRFYPGAPYFRLIFGTAGFVIAEDMPFSLEENRQYTLDASIVEVEGGTKYKLDFTLSGLVGGVPQSYTKTYTGLKTSVGSLTGFSLVLAEDYTTERPVAQFSAFSVSQIPEPSPLILLATGVLGLLACARRRRK